MATPRRQWFHWHSRLGLPVWSLLALVCLTGAVAAVSGDIQWLVNPAARAGPGPALGLNQVMERVATQLPATQILRITLPEPGWPAMALKMRAASPDLANATLWVNPADGRVESVVSGPDFPDLVKALHGWLFWPFLNGAPPGWYLVTLLSVPLLVLVVTGLAVHKRFWRTYTTRPRLRLNRDARLAWGDLHRLAGAWIWGFVVIMAVTGGWFLIRGVMYDLHIPVEATPPDLDPARVPVTTSGHRPPPPDLDGALTRLRTTRPGARPFELVMPEHAGAPLVVRLRPAWGLGADRAWIDPYDGSVIAIHDFAAQSAAEAVTPILVNLHYGDFAGLGLRVAWAVLGLGLTTMIVSGMVIWHHRTKRATADPPRSWPARLAREAKAHALVVVALAVPLAWAPVALRPPPAKPGLGAMVLTPQTLGPVTATLAAAWRGGPRVDDSGARRKLFRLRLDGVGMDQVRDIRLAVAGVPAAGAVFEGTFFRLHAHLPLDRDLTADDTLVVTLTEWNGHRHQALWSLPP